MAFQWRTLPRMAETLSASLCEKVEVQMAKGGGCRRSATAPIPHSTEAGGAVDYDACSMPGPHCRRWTPGPDAGEQGWGGPRGGCRCSAMGPTPAHALHSTEVEGAVDYFACSVPEPHPCKCTPAAVLMSVVWWQVAKARVQAKCNMPEPHCRT